MSTEGSPTPEDRTEESAYMAANYQVSMPEPFCFSRPEEWVKWVRRFERFRMASGLALSEEDRPQVNALIYAMGDEGDEILRSFTLSEEEQKNYVTVKSKFDSHFCSTTQRSSMNGRSLTGGDRKTGESVDTFITALYALAKHCGVWRSPQ